MDGMLPPVDAASWLDFQRRRAEQVARQRIAAAGATAGDWIGRATSTLDQVVPDWTAPPPAPAVPAPDAFSAPPAPAPAAPGGDWTQSALDRIGQLGSDLGGAVGSTIDQAQGIIPQAGATAGAIGSGIGDTFSGLGTATQGALQGLQSATQGLGAAAGDLNAQATGALNTQGDALTDWLRTNSLEPGLAALDRTRQEQRADLGDFTDRVYGATPGGAPTGAERERKVDQLAFDAGVGESVAGGLRNAAGRATGLARRGVRLTEEQVAQRARDGAAEQRVFDAIQKLWRRGADGEAAADDLRFLAVGKGEDGERAARAYLADKGLTDVLPDATGAATPRAALGLGLGAAAPAATGDGDGAPWQERAAGALGAAGAGVRDLLGAAGETAGAVADPGMWLRGALAVSPMGETVRQAFEKTPYQFRQGVTDKLGPIKPQGLGAARDELERNLADAPLTQWLDAQDVQIGEDDEKMARMALGALPGAGGRPADVSPEEWAQAVRRAKWLRETGQNVAGAGGLKLPSANQALEAASSVPLMSLTSQLRNLTSGGARSVERLLVRALSGHPLEAVDEAGTMLGALKPGGGVYTKARQAFTQGPTARNPGATGPSAGADSLYASTAPGAIAATSGTRANAALDEVVRSANEAAALRTGTRRGYTGQQLDDFVKQAGDYATVTGANSPIATALNKAKMMAGDPTKSPLERGVGLVAQAFAPYVAMPERLLVASTRAVVDPVYAPAEYAIRRFLTKNPMAYEELQGRFLLGLGADIGLWQAAGKGGLYGRPPRDPKRRAAMERAGAHWDAFVGPGGVVIPLSYLGTFGQAAGLVADAQQAQQQAMETGKPANEQVSALLNRALSRTLDQSYVADFGDFLEKWGNDQATEALTDLGASQLGRFGAALASPVNATDPLARDTRGPGGAAARIVPGGRYALPAKIDPATGEPVRRQGTGLGRMLGVNAGEETSALGRELSERGVTAPDFRNGKYTGVAQTPAQLEAIKKAYGSEVGREARATVASREYQEARPLDKAKLLEQAVARAKAEADIRLGDRVKRSPKAQATFEYAAVPQFEGVKGGPDEVRRQNAQVAEAKRRVTAARAKYPGDPDKGERELIASSRETVRLAERARVPAAELRPKRAAIYAKHGLNAEGQDEAALDEEAGG